MLRAVEVAARDRVQGVLAVANLDPARAQRVDAHLWPEADR
jgi:hypothetical protein